ncbi:MAG: MFS transporter permease [Actinomycetota bacterium]
MRAWLFEKVPRGRVAVLRAVLYTFIFVDVLLTTSWIARHAALPGELYHPLLLGRWLPLPVPGAGYVRTVEIALLLCAALAATGRAPRAAGAAVALLYLQWMLIGMSYGKVDHDRFAFLVALAVLPTVGPARWGDHTADESSGWAIRSVQVAVVLTYLLASYAKLRYGGIAWLDGSTLMRAVIRRGTYLAEPLKDMPGVLRVGQYLIMLFELASPLLLVRGRVGRSFLVAALLFHLTTYATITIIFLPHVMCLLSFVPLERLRPPRLVGRVLSPAPVAPAR